MILVVASSSLQAIPNRGGPTEHGIICLNRITGSIFLSKLTGIMLIC